MKQIIKKIYNFFTHLFGKVTRRYYFEDYIRVYPVDVAFNRFGMKRHPSEDDINNFKNHCKFYRFTAQFVKDKIVADIGCGAGYGAEILSKAGARKIYGCDLSKQAIEFARRRFNKWGEFSVQNAVDLKEYPDRFADVVILSEVLEHVKEYNVERRAIEELKRVTKSGGIIIISTPNTELLKGHGFSYDEIRALCDKFFKTYCLFENALEPFYEDTKREWEKRKLQNRTGIIVTQDINLEETVLLKEAKSISVKQGISTGVIMCGSYAINTALLHNTHSWVVVATEVLS